MASRGVNKVIIVGNLGNDPEMNHMPSGGSVTNISVATSEAWKDKNTNEDKEKTEWHRIVFFNRLSEIAGEYLKKGGKVYIEGSLRTRKWQAQDGSDRYTTEIVANQMQMLDSRGDNGGSSLPHDGSGAGPGEKVVGKSSMTGEVGRHPSAGGSGGFDGFDDDIPF